MGVNVLPRWARVVAVSCRRGWLEKLNLVLPVAAPSTQPAEAQIKLRLPRRMKVPTPELWGRAPSPPSGAQQAVLVSYEPQRTTCQAALPRITQRAVPSVTPASGSSSSSGVKWQSRRWRWQGSQNQVPNICI